jgi:phosphatidylglycerophosphatase A
VAEPDDLPAGFVKLWIAQGFGVGRIPVAPGTFGSVVGIAWFALLLLTGNVWVFVAGTVAGVALSVWLCGVGEKVLLKKDPQSVVLDEITAMPVCFLGWVLLVAWKTGALPPLGLFFSSRTWAQALGVFVLFRLFDVLKPWPVRQSQALTGGWGVTIDDVLAAVYVNLVLLLVYGGKVLLR